MFFFDLFFLFFFLFFVFFLYFLIIFLFFYLKELFIVDVRVFEELLCVLMKLCFSDLLSDFEDLLIEEVLAFLSH